MAVIEATSPRTVSQLCLRPLFQVGVWKEKEGTPEKRLATESKGDEEGGNNLFGNGREVEGNIGRRWIFQNDCTHSA